MSPLSLFPVFFFSFTIRLNPRIYKLIVLLVASSHLVCIHTYVCVYMCVETKDQPWGEFFLMMPPFSFCQGLSFTWHLMIELGWLASEPRGPSCPALPQHWD